MIKKFLRSSPFPVKMTEECNKALAILKEEADAADTYNKSSKNVIEEAQCRMGTIPTELIDQCKGIAIMVVSKSSLLLGGATMGNGVLMRRTETGWSLPAAIGTIGLVFGPQFGLAKMNVIYLLRTDEALEAFQQNNVKLAGALSVAAGPVGRNTEVAGTGGDVATAYDTVAPVFVYCLSKGLHIGATIEGTFIVQRPEANEKFYGKLVGSDEIVAGKVTADDITTPEGGEAVETLHKALETRLKKSTF